MLRSFGNATNIMIKANELEHNTQMYVDFMSKFTGKDKEAVRKDIGRNRYGGGVPAAARVWGAVVRVRVAGEEGDICQQQMGACLPALLVTRTRFAEKPSTLSTGPCAPQVFPAPLRSAALAP